MSDQPHHDDRHAVELLRPLAGEPSGPARLDVARAMAEGRRRRRSRWWAGGTALVALTATTAAGGTLALSALGRPAPEPPRPIASPVPSVTAAAPADRPRDCTVTRLPTKGVKKALVTGGDPSGTWLVGRTYPASARTEYRPLALWKNGELVGTPRIDGTEQILRDVNSLGVAVGTSNNPGVLPYAYRDGKVSVLKGGEGSASAINDAGVVVGALGPGGAARPTRWSSLTAQPEGLPLPAGTGSASAMDIDEAGNVLGMIATTDGDGTAYLWLADGSGRRMPMPLVDGRRADKFWPSSIRNGWVVGQGVVGTRDPEAIAFFRYRIDAGRYELLPDAGGVPSRVAANGWVLGEAERPVITSGDGVTTVLPRYGQAKGRQDYIVSSFSDDGRVAAGYAVGADIQNQPLMWRCR